MARKRTGSQQPEELPLLRVRHEQFATELDDRIAKGKDILGASARDPESR